MPAPGSGWIFNAQVMAQLVTRPVEEAMRVIPGVLEVTSGSSRGGAQISVDFGWGRDMTAATLQVDTALSHILPSLPAGTKSVTRRMEPTVFPIIAFGLTSDKVSIPELRDLVKFQIRPLLTTVPGLAKVDLVGGADAEVQVQVERANSAYERIIAFSPLWPSAWIMAGHMMADAKPAKEWEGPYVDRFRK